MVQVYIKTVNGGEDTTPAGTDAIELDDGTTSRWALLSNLYKAIGSGTQDATTFLRGDGTYAEQPAVDGWITGTGTWSYSSADDPTFIISINADVTALIGVGDRIKLTQTTAKYFIVTAVGAFGGGATLVTVYGGTDYDLANAAITSPYYSHAKAPFGFPLSPVKWTVELTDTTDRDQASTVQNTWYNTGSLSISIPIGAWHVWYRVNAQLLDAATYSINVAISTANNSASDGDLKGQFTGTGQYAMAPFTVEKVLVLAAKTPYYVNQMNSSGTQGIRMANSAVNLIVRARCAYL